jgi:ElaB/YqjD/DUF883 family membrane-anchored ribosome-binding protein
MTTESTITREKLAAEMKAVIADAEELLKVTAGQTGDEIQSTRAHVEETLRSAKNKMEDWEHVVVEKVKDAAKATDRYVHDNPWPSIGIAAGIGLVVGWLIGRK